MSSPTYLQEPNHPRVAKILLNVFSAPHTTRRHHEIKKAHSHSDNIHGPNKRMGGFSKNATVGLHLPNPECCIETRPSLPALLPFRGRGGFRPLPVTQLKDSIQANTELKQNSELKLSYRNKMIPRGKPNVHQ